MQARPVGVAHAYGNRRSRIARALAAGVDLIEADLRWQRGEIWVRHEYRLWPAPLLYNLGLRGIHRQGPWAVNVGPLFLRVDVRPMRFRELLAAVEGRAGLMLDLKAAPYSPRDAEAFVAEALEQIDRAGFAGRVDYCGSWRLIDTVRRLRPDQRVHYSIDGDDDWRALEQRAADRAPIGAITIHKDLLTAQRAAILTARRCEYYVWDVLTRADAERAIEAGASGLIADDLGLLREFTRRPKDGVRTSC